MKIIIAGAGEVGTHLAKMLSGEKQDIILMDTDEEKLGQLEDNFDLMTVNASSLSIAGLKEANVPNADLFIGVTPDEKSQHDFLPAGTQPGRQKDRSTHR